MPSSLHSVSDGPKRRLNQIVGAIALTGLIAALVALPPAAPTADAAEPAGIAPVAVPAAASPKIVLPRTALAKATIRGWSVAPATSFAEIGAEVGNASEGAIALRVDAPVLASARNAVSTPITLQPSTTYRFSARVRVLSTKATASGIASFTIGAAKVAVLPAMNAKWKTVTGTYTTGADETTAKLALLVSKAVRGLAIDQLSLTAGDGPNVVPNSSFEDVVASRGIASTSLVTTTGTAAVALALPRGRATWSLARGSKTVQTGSISVASTVAALPIKASQGYYTLRVRGSDKKLFTTTLIVIDSPTPWVALDSRFGVGLHVENGTYTDAARHTRALGIAQVRNDIRWQTVEPRKMKWDFDQYDAPFAKLKAQGVKILGVVGYGNKAYGSANKYAPTTATGIKAYARYSAVVAKRYDLIGLEVFNEFNHASHNKSKKTAAKYYAPLVKAVNSSVNKVKPRMPIIAGSTARYPAAWFNQLWAKGALKYSDAVSFHPYETTSKPETLTGVMKQARTSMRKYGKTTKPVWITELGTSSRTGNRTPTEQASVLMRSSITAFSSGARKFFWYDLINDTADKADQMSNFGLYSHPAKGIAAVKPKPAAFAQVLTITQLGNRSFRKTESVGAGVVSQAFGKTTDTVRVVWATSGTKTATIRTSKPVTLVKFDGTKSTLKPKGGVVKIKVTTNPVFIRSGSATAGVIK